MSEPQVLCCTQMPTPDETRAVGEKRKYFKSGQTITATIRPYVPQVVQDNIRRAMAELFRDAKINLHISWSGDPDSMWRIGVKRGYGAWAYVGTDAKLITDPNQDTMNLGWLTPETDYSEYRRLVGHETLHALGGLHEMVSSVDGISWNREVALKYYADTQGWSAEMVENNVFAKVDASLVDQTPFDNTSLLCYPIPVEHVTNPAHAADWNMWLSPQDVEFWSKIYAY